MLGVNLRFTGGFLPQFQTRYHSGSLHAGSWRTLENTKSHTSYTATCFSKDYTQDGIHVASILKMNMDIWEYWFHWWALTIISPVSVPGVGTQPVWDAILHPPAQDFNGMATQRRPGNMFIHTWTTSRFSKSEEHSVQGFVKGHPSQGYEGTWECLRNGDALCQSVLVDLQIQWIWVAGMHRAHIGMACLPDL